MQEKTMDNTAEVSEDFRKLMNSESVLEIRMTGRSVRDGREIIQKVIIYKPTSSNGLFQVQSGVPDFMFNLMYLHKIRMDGDGIHGYRVKFGKTIHVADIALKAVRIVAYDHNSCVFCRAYGEDKTEE